MEKTLYDEFIKTVTELYDMEIFSKLMEFCQGELRTLYYLDSLGGKDAQPSEISDVLHVSRARTTATLASLRNKGYIEMNISPTDRRKMQVRMTASGKNYYAKYRATAEGYVRAYIDRAGEDSVRKLLEILRSTILANRQ